MAITISLRVMVVVACALIAIISGTIAFLPLYLSAESAAFQTAQEFVDTVSQNLVTSIAPFFTSAQDELTVLLAAVKFRGFDTKTLTSRLQWLSYAHYSTNNYFSTSIFMDNGTWTTVARSSTLLALKSTNLSTFLVVMGDANVKTLIGSIREEDNVANIIGNVQLAVSSYDPRQRPFWSPCRNDRVWTAPFVDAAGSLSVMMAGAPILWGTSPPSSSKGLIGIRVESTGVYNFLQTVHFSKTGVVFLLNGEVFIGGNFDENPVTAQTSGSTKVKSISDVSNPKVSGLLAEHRDQILYCDTPCRFLSGSGHDTKFVRVDGIEDTYGLQLRVVVVVASRDYLDQIWVSSQIGIGAASGAIAGFVLVIVITLHFLLRPLGDLSEKLLMCAALRSFAGLASEESNTGVWWHLQEVNVVENSLKILARQMKVLRSYLPQSVLEHLDDDLPDGAEADEVFSVLATTVADAGADPSELVAGLSLGVACAEVYSDAEESSVESSMSDNCSVDNTAAAASAQLHGNSITVAIVPDVEHAATTSATPPAQPQRTTSDHTSENRRVTVLMINLRGTHAILQHGGLEELHKKMEQATAFILMVAKRHKGVVDWCNGDHFMLTFNASRLCSSSASRAASAALAISSCWLFQSETLNPREHGPPAIRQRTTFTGVSIGISTGNAFCGYFGCDKMRRFGVIGSCVNEAVVLMQHAARCDIPCLIAPSTRDIIATDFEMLHCVLTQISSASGNVIASTIVGTFQQQEVCSEFLPARDSIEAAVARANRGLVNTIFEKLIHGNVEEARAMAMKAIERRPNDPAVIRALAACNSMM